MNDSIYCVNALTLWRHITAILIQFTGLTGKIKAFRCGRPLISIIVIIRSIPVQVNKH